jgi:hypothetical protein
LPMTQESVKAFTDAASIQWPSGPIVAPPSSPREGDSERWVERTYRVPVSVAEVLDQALAKAKMAFSDTLDHSDAECLEVIAAEFLAGS